MSARREPGDLVQWECRAALQHLGVVLKRLPNESEAPPRCYVRPFIAAPVMAHRRVAAPPEIVPEADLQTAGLGRREYLLREWLQQRRGRIWAGAALGQVVSVPVPRPVTRAEVRDLSDAQAACLLLVLRANQRGHALHLVQDDRAVRALLRRQLDALELLRLVGGGWARSPAEPSALQLLERRARIFWFEREQLQAERLVQLAGSDERAAIALALGLPAGASSTRILKLICKLRGEGGISL